MKKVLICDDHSIIRRGLKFIFLNKFYEYEIIETKSINQTMLHLKNDNPEFAIFDLQLADGNMIDTLPTILSLYPDLNVLVFSMSNEEIYAKKILQMGAKGFLTKNEDEEEVTRALDIFLHGQNYISQKINTLLIENLRGNKGKIIENPFAQLSSRESEVTRHLLNGTPIKNISVHMDLHSNTVVTYKHRLLTKLAVANIMELKDLAKVYAFE